MLANGKDTGGLHTIIVQIPVAIATVIAKTCEFPTHCLQIFLILKAISPYLSEWSIFIYCWSILQKMGWFENKPHLLISML